MPRYYFNFKDGETLLDPNGIEFADMEAVKHEAVKSGAEMLRSVKVDHLWSGDPWVLWVSDQPNGGGQTLLTLKFSATVAH
jgi:hypothetical protein